MGCSFLLLPGFPRGRVCYVMRAFVITGPRQFTVADVAGPEAAAGQVVVDVERAGRRRDRAQDPHRPAPAERLTLPPAGG
jgi:hypothetical protein